MVNEIHLYRLIGESAELVETIAISGNLPTEIRKPKQNCLINLIAGKPVIYHEIFTCLGKNKDGSYTYILTTIEEYDSKSTVESGNLNNQILV